MLPALVLLTSACTVTGTAVPVGGNLALVDTSRRSRCAWSRGCERQRHWS
ncbi:hypothetical protein [Amycolatopsis vancoresmycina]|nr:hypothetical protein [Amycolatopsis vancoresmycina]